MHRICFAPALLPQTALWSHVGRWMVAGLAAGAILAVAAPPQSPTQAKPSNVVVLRKEPMVSLVREKATLKQICDEFARQTGCTITMPPGLEVDAHRYNVLLRGVPLGDALAPLCFLADATATHSGKHWDVAYATPEDRAQDTERYTMIVDRLRNYLSTLDPMDPSLDPCAGECLMALRQNLLARLDRSRTLTLEDMRSAEIRVGERKLTFYRTETAHDGNATAGQSHSETFFW